MKRKISFAIGVILLGMLVIGSNHHHRVAADYERILRKTHIRLPEVAKVQSWDNYDRGASRWDCLEHKIVFDKWPSQKSIDKMERLCVNNQRWSKEETNGIVYYTFNSAKEWDSDLYFYSICIFENNAHIEYYIDEDEGLFCYLIFIPLLFIWLIVLILQLSVSSNQKSSSDTSKEN